MTYRCGYPPALGALAAQQLGPRGRARVLEVLVFVTPPFDAPRFHPTRSVGHAMAGDRLEEVSEHSVRGIRPPSATAKRNAPTICTAPA